MKRFLSVLMIGTLWLATALAGDNLESGFSNLQLEAKSSSHLNLKNPTLKKGNTKYCPGPTGPIGPVGKRGKPGPNFGQYACLYSNEAQTLTIGQNVLFANEISLSGIQYDSTTGVFTLPAGIYSVTYFSTLINVNLVSNGSVVPNSPLGGCVTVLILSQDSNTIALQAQSSISLGSLASPLCNAMITIYQID